MQPAFVKTPLLSHYFTASSKNVPYLPQFLLKAEFLQPSGSFKSRGIGHLITRQVSKIRSKGCRFPHVFASSGGNAGLAAAITSKNLSVPCDVVVPRSTSDRMVEKIRNFGADVHVYGRNWKEADTFLKEKIMFGSSPSKTQEIYVHPFDHPLIWEGHSSIVDEIIDSLEEQKIDLENVKAIVCSVGGGGLYNGIIEGLSRHKLAHKIPIVGVESKGCEVFSRSLKLGKLIEFDDITSIATSIGTNSISKKTLENAIRYHTKSIVLTDQEIISTCLKFADETNIIPEPACGASLHIGYHPNLLYQTLGLKPFPEDIIIMVGCGGSTTSYEDLVSLSAKGT
ncbi:LAQU0S15e00122g1_1 [Lachancea quebecensis]|uniref:L-serine ammonia-lyase n=1 Tax=Lachancea quebecensis TaxID=1654605 RepID=A0A0N7MM66_9SACH|nr:LAQU0S15e00122g1_1 [Lachancea quebecensis]